MTADPMPTATLIGSLLLTLAVPIAVGLIFAGVQWLAGRRTW